jgi:hypothetical protein
MEEEDTKSYHQAFQLSFQTAESDVSRHLPWAHLLSKSNPPKSSRSPIAEIKAILLDKHSGQFKGLGKYFETEYSSYGDEWHI